MLGLLLLSFTFLFLGMGLPLVAYFQPRLVVQMLSERFPSVYFNFPTLFEHTPPIVALTIDDAVSNNTPQILNILEKYSVKATFFVIGSNIVDYRENQPEGEEDLLLKIVKDGHELGNHMWKDEPSISLDSEKFKEQFLAVDDILEKVHEEHLRIVGKKEVLNYQNEERYLQFPSERSKWFRPGSGWFNSNMLSVVNSYGYRLALGDIYPHDPLVTSSSINSWHVLKRVHSGGIIILHDRNHTLETLETILPALNRRGYKVVTLSEMLAMHDSVSKTT